MLRKQTRQKLNIENLESRQMMAGDVSAYSISKILYVNGDSLSNGIVLTSDVNGVITVAGIEQSGSATTINGGASSTFTKIKDIVISMNKGDDAIVATDLFVNGNLYISGGKDNDAIGLGEFDDTNGLVDDAVDSLLGALTVKKSFVIDSGDGDDALLGRNVTVNKSLVVSMGTGNDIVQFDADGLGPGVNVLKTATISTSTGDDQVSLYRMTVAKSLTISTHNDQDLVELDSVTTKTLSVPLGSGDDEVTVENSSITKKATFNGDSGLNDYTDLGSNTFNKLTRKNFQNLV
jgi:hypothetical protein